MTVAHTSDNLRINYNSIDARYLVFSIDTIFLYTFLGPRFNNLISYIYFIYYILFIFYL